VARTATEESDGSDGRDGAEPSPAWIAHVPHARDFEGLPQRAGGAGDLRRLRVG